ncbi:MAG: alpha-glucosidase C-terminal domain-containing protein, partial [Chloroflexota bacterium]
MIALRDRHRCFGRGSTVFVDAGTDHALAFVRECADDRVLCVFNLSRYTRPLSLDLSRWNGKIPVEMFGAVRFPAAGAGRWPLTLGPR